MKANLCLNGLLLFVIFAALFASNAAAVGINPGTYIDTLNVNLTNSPYVWTPSKFCDAKDCFITSVTINGFLYANNSGNSYIYIESSGNAYTLFDKNFQLNTTLELRNITTEETVQVYYPECNCWVPTTMMVTREVNVTIDTPANFSITGTALIEGYNETLYNIYFKSQNRTIKINSIAYTWQKLVGHNKINNKIMRPSFIADNLLEIKGISETAVFARIYRARTNTQELWIYDLGLNAATQIGAQNAAPSPYYRIGVKGGTVFWVSESRANLFSMNISNKAIRERAIPPFDVSMGQRGIVNYPEIDWEVRVSGYETGELYFYSTATGEVFSDDNSDIKCAFRNKYQLTDFLTEEQLNNIGLSGCS